MKKLMGTAGPSMTLISALVALFASLAALLLVTLLWDQLQRSENSPEAQENVGSSGAPAGPEEAPKNASEAPAKPEGMPKNEVNPSKVPARPEEMPKNVNPPEAQDEQQGVRRGANSSEAQDQSEEVK